MTCPVCAELATAGLEQEHPDYPKPELGDWAHGQYDPSNPASAYYEGLDDEPA